VPAPSDDYNPAVAANELAKHVEKMDTAWGPSPVREKQHSALDSIPSFLTGLLLRFVFTIVALKLAFKYWEMDAFWSGILTIAAIDLILHATLELLGAATGGFTTLAVVENGIPGLVLIYTINRFCFNKRIQNAVLTAAAVKVLVTLCYVFAGVAMLNLIYG
jgi:F0F1-type ATP synthase assembly protein I